MWRKYKWFLPEIWKPANKTQLWSFIFSNLRMSLQTTWNISQKDRFFSKCLDEAKYNFIIKSPPPGVKTIVYLADVCNRNIGSLKV